jgi:hypothetical protein
MPRDKKINGLLVETIPGHFLGDTAQSLGIVQRPYFRIPPYRMMHVKWGEASCMSIQTAKSSVQKGNKIFRGAKPSDEQNQKIEAVRPSKIWNIQKVRS